MLGLAVQSHIADAVTTFCHRYSGASHPRTYLTLLEQGECWYAD